MGEKACIVSVEEVGAASRTRLSLPSAITDAHLAGQGLCLLISKIASTLYLLCQLSSQFDYVATNRAFFVSLLDVLLHVDRSCLVLFLLHAVINKREVRLTAILRQFTAAERASYCALLDMFESRKVPLVPTEECSIPMVFVILQLRDDFIMRFNHLFEVRAVQFCVSRNCDWNQCSCKW